MQHSAHKVYHLGTKAEIVQLIKIYMGEKRSKKKYPISFSWKPTSINLNKNSSKYNCTIMLVNACSLYESISVFCLFSDGQNWTQAAYTHCVCMSIFFLSVNRISVWDRVRGSRLQRLTTQSNNSKNNKNTSTHARTHAHECICYIKRTTHTRSHMNCIKTNQTIVENSGCVWDRKREWQNQK